MVKKRNIHPNTIAQAKKNKAPTWVKGQSGNPDGMPKGTKHRATILKELMDIILKQNGKPVANPLDPDEKKITIEKAMQVKMIEKALKGDIAAYELIMDTIYGKIATKNEHTGADGKPLNPMPTSISVVLVDPKEE
jgi:hypothetical protein